MELSSSSFLKSQQTREKDVSPIEVREELKPFAFRFLSYNEMVNFFCLTTNGNKNANQYNTF